MTHAWMNLLAVIFTSFTTINSASIATEAAWEEGDSVVSEYAVVECVEDDEVILETVRGSFSIPRAMLSEEMEREGAVLEIRLALDEEERRLARSHERLERMASQNVIEL